MGSILMKKRIKMLPKVVNSRHIGNDKTIFFLPVVKNEKDSKMKKIREKVYFFADLSVHPVSYYNSFFLARDKSQKFNPKLTKIINFWYIWRSGGHKRALP